MKRLIFIPLLAGCASLVDREASNYIPFARYERYIYEDANGGTFVVSVYTADSLYSILDWQGQVEYLRYDGDWMNLYNRVEYSLNGSRVVAYEGYIPYYPYPFVDGYAGEFSYSGNGIEFRISCGVSLMDGMRYGVEISYRESNPEGGRSFYRHFVFAPDTGIVEAIMGPDTSIVAGDTLITGVRNLRLLRVE